MTRSHSDDITGHSRERERENAQNLNSKTYFIVLH